MRKSSLGGDVFLSLRGLPLLFQRPKLDKVEFEPLFVFLGMRRA
jgi:hypothetical protein